MTRHLARVLPTPPDKPVPPAAEADAFRTFARGLAAGTLPWTTETANFIGGLFDSLAERWDTEQASGRSEPVLDALDRGGRFPRGVCLELGSGTGTYTPALSRAFTTVISVDLSQRMLQQARGRSPVRIRADASRLPLPDGSVGTVVAVDILLFAQETARVLRSDGVLLWINQLGPQGPLFLPGDDVARALPGTWQAVEADAGWGTWASLRRARYRPVSSERVTRLAAYGRTRPRRMRSRQSASGEAGRVVHAFTDGSAAIRPWRPFRPARCSATRSRQEPCAG
ncbi:class I SAM-dependent methyltransferase [Streptomyces sp. SPB162]|uniref:class I SAM-dependent methyltransferase n=1 Tax=Streptomyces sp. SPB162 TaxID=2940560 RepID=UPI0024056EF3|nr:class I SAM-dependent methyltransferase [Streptomyces sp. SPB162]MDF9817185.1 SAM-dependent methyltransferase [Streptomyces sp. SPB162]